MFYSKLLFVKKGALAKVWLAAHSQRKLTKIMIVQTQITESVDNVINPPEPLALRLSGQLLLGLVRIYQRKVRYLQDDCSDALTKMKMVFRPGVVDLQPRESVALPNAINLPENLDMMMDLEMDMPLDLELLVQPHDDDLAADMSFTFHQGELWDEEKELELESLAPEQQEMKQRPPKPAADTTMNTTFQEDVEIPLLALEDEEKYVPFEQPEMPEIDYGGAYEEKDKSALDLDVTHEEKVAEAPVEQAVQAEEEALVVEEEAAEEKVKKQRKRKLDKVDLTVELDKKTIQSNIKDTRDIVTQRPTIPLTKKAKTSRDILRSFEVASMSHVLAPELAAVTQLSLSKEWAPLRGESAEEKEEALAGGEEAAVPMDEEFVPFEQPEMPEIDYGVPREEAVPVPADLSAVMDEPAAAEQQLRGREDEKEAPASEFAAMSTEEQEQQAAAKGVSKRTKKMYHLLHNRMQNEDVISFSSLVPKTSARDIAAGIFYELLVLKSHDYIDVKQPEPFADIDILKTHHFDAPLPTVSV